MNQTYSFDPTAPVFYPPVANNTEEELRELKSAVAELNRLQTATVLEYREQMETNKREMELMSERIDQLSKQSSSSSTIAHVLKEWLNRPSEKQEDSPFTVASQLIKYGFMSLYLVILGIIIRNVMTRE